MAEKRFVALISVEHEEELGDGRATDAALAAIEGMGRLLFPAFAKDAGGEERVVSLVGLEILGEERAPRALAAGGGL